MKITIHWDRVLGLAVALVGVLVAILCFKLFNQSNYFHHEEIGQCDMAEAQTMIDTLVGAKRGDPSYPRRDLF